VPETVVAVTHLSRRFGNTAALQDVSVTVGRGSVFGLVGENGAGKSTLLKHLLGLWRAETGDVRVFGRDPVTDPVSVLGRIGYLSEQPELPGWMRVSDLLRYTQAFYPRWDTTYAEQLREQFGLDPGARIRTLSKGQHARLGLLAAEAHRPDLLILDEPSSGLDPIVRRDILEAIIRTVADEGRTVIFSSHLLDEVERVSDHLAAGEAKLKVFVMPRNRLPDGPALVGRQLRDPAQQVGQLGLAPEPLHALLLERGHAVGGADRLLGLRAQRCDAIDRAHCAGTLVHS
jgi:ABC-2 type transport system ATP-binding protein